MIFRLTYHPGITMKLSKSLARTKKVVHNPCSICRYVVHMRKAIYFQGRAVVNFINILCAQFSYKSALHSFLYLPFSFVIFGAKISGKEGHVKCWWNWHLMFLRTLFSTATNQSLETNFTPALHFPQRKRLTYITNFSFLWLIHSHSGFRIL